MEPLPTPRDSEAPEVPVTFVLSSTTVAVMVLILDEPTSIDKTYIIKNLQVALELLNHNFIKSKIYYTIIFLVLG